MNTILGVDLNPRCRLHRAADRQRRLLRRQLEQQQRGVLRQGRARVTQRVALSAVVQVRQSYKTTFDRKDKHRLY